MSDAFYLDLQGVAADVLGQFKQGTVTLTRVERAEPDEDAPDVLGAVTATLVFTLSATVKGVNKKFVDGTMVLADDLVVTTSPVVLLDGSKALLETIELSDILKINDVSHVIHKVEAKPAAGPTVAFLVFVAR